MSSFGKRLKKLRNEANLYQKELAEKVGFPRSTIAAWESGLRTPEMASTETLADFFGVSIDYLLGRVDSPMQKPNRAGGYLVHEGGPKYDPDAEYASKRIVDALESKPELLTVWKELLNRGEMQLLFKQVSGMSDETIRKVISIIKIIEDEEAQETE